MKRATAIFLYKEDTDKDDIRYYQMVNISVVTRDNQLVTICKYELDKDEAKPYKYYSFHNMYDGILSLVRINGFYLSSYENFGRRWYDIQFINIDRPYEVKRYSHSWH